MDRWAERTEEQRRDPRDGYYDNSLVVYGYRVAVTQHPVHGWGWFFEDLNDPPVRGWQDLKNIRTLEAEVRAALPPEFVAHHEAMNAEYGPNLHWV